MQTNPAQRLRSIRGFTMSELMVGLAVMSLTMAGIVAFTFQALNVYAYDSGRLLVNHDIRKFTGDMITDAVYANYFQIYPSFTSRAVPQSDGQTGDFLLLVTTTIDSSGNTTIARLVGYYRDATSTTTGPVRKFVATPSPAPVIGPTTNTGLNPPVYTMSDLLDAYAPTSASASNGIIIQLAQGLSNGNMFYNYYSRSIMIRGQINEQGSMVRRAVNTYNFTVSPRG